MYDKLVKKVNNINTNRIKTKCDADKRELDKKSLDTNELVKKTNYNNKISHIEKNTKYW